MCTCENTYRHTRVGKCRCTRGYIFCFTQNRFRAYKTITILYSRDVCSIWKSVQLRITRIFLHRAYTVLRTTIMKYEFSAGYKRTECECENTIRPLVATAAAAAVVHDESFALGVKYNSCVHHAHCIHTTRTVHRIIIIIAVLFLLLLCKTSRRVYTVIRAIAYIFLPFCFFCFYFLGPWRVWAPLVTISSLHYCSS